LIFRREPLHQRLAREAGLGDPGAEDTRAPWDKAGIHGVHRPREWDEVTTAFIGPDPVINAGPDQARFVVLEHEILVEEGPENVERLAAALSLNAPYRGEAVRRDEGVWAVAGRRIAVATLPGVEGTQLEYTHHGGERGLVVDGERRFGSIPALDHPGDYVVRGHRLVRDQWEVETSPL